MDSNSMVGNISVGTIARTIVLVLFALNFILKQFGISLLDFLGDVSEDDMVNKVENIIFVISALVAWWYNNSFTKRARIGDIYSHILDGEDVDYILNREEDNNDQ